jgi:SIR2-like domain
LALIDAARNRRALEELIALLREGQSYAMTGAGVSVWAGYRTWKQVIDRLAAVVADRRGAEVDAQMIVRNYVDLLFCARALGRELSPEQFAEFIGQEFGPNGKPPHEVLFRLAQMPFRHVLTLNFEKSFEEAHAALGLQCGTLSCCSRPSIASFLASMDLAAYPRQVVHLHGLYSDPNDIIALTENGYRQLYRENQLFQQFLWLLSATKRIVFFGFGFEDTDFLNAMRNAARDVYPNGTRHFAIMHLNPGEDDAPIRQRLNDRYLVEPIFYELVEDGGDRFAGFPALINGIAHELALPALPAVELAGPPALEPAVEPADLQRAADLAEQLLGRIDPGGNNV